MVWILQKLCLPVVSSLRQASSLRGLVNNISFIGGVGFGARDMDATKALPPCCIKFGAGILSSCSCKLYQFYRRSGIWSSRYGSYKGPASLLYQVWGRHTSLRALVNNINFVGGAGSGARGMDPTKAPPPCGIKFGAGMLSRGVSSVGKDLISVFFFGYL